MACDRINSSSDGSGLWAVAYADLKVIGYIHLCRGNNAATHFDTLLKCRLTLKENNLLPSCRFCPLRVDHI